MTVSAQSAPELRLLSAHAVDGMRGGNLSGLAQCGKDLWSVSDRDDEQIYLLDTREPVWQAEPVRIEVPAVPDSGLPWGLRSRTWAASLARGGDLDFEGITCDNAGNRYIVSERNPQGKPLSGTAGTSMRTASACQTGSRVSSR